jgi:hypothetical protein
VTVILGEAKDLLSFVRDSFSGFGWAQLLPQCVTTQTYLSHPAQRAAKTLSYVHELCPEI